MTQSRRSQAIKAAAEPPPETASSSLEPSTSVVAPGPSPLSAGNVKLSYKERRELESLPDQITTLEREQGQLRQELADGSLYANDPQRAATLYQRDAAIEEELMLALSRWEELSARGG
jgi:ATP-binding cassette subfamily F protein uup